MKLELKDYPREYRKAVLLAALGLAISTSVVRWRGHVSEIKWLGILTLLVVVAVTACFRPRWFRGYYRFTAKLAFYISQAISFIVLTILFFVFFTPVGLILRILGKDPLRMRRTSNVKTYWAGARRASPLDRLY